MLAVSSVTTIPAALAVPPSALAVTAVDLVSTRATPVAVAAPLSISSVANDSHTSMAYVSTHSPNGTANETLSAAGESVGGSSSAFLAQLISQDDSETQDNQIGLATSFARFAPALQYTTFVGYSVVKYRPSDAGLPSGYSGAVEVPLAQRASQAAETTEYQAYNSTQSRNLSNLFPLEPQVSVAG